MYKMIALRSLKVLRLSSNLNVQRIVQCCGFKSRYNIENLYPNTSSDLTVKVRQKMDCLNVGAAGSDSCYLI